MSSLELLSLAEDVVQFVHLALETTTTTDAPMDSDAIYDKFHHLQSRLEDATRSKLIVPRQLEDEFFAVKALAGDCKMDCDRLMSMLRPLTHSDEDSGYSSSRHPSKRRRREREAMGFKQRLERRQEVVSLQICKFMRCVVGNTVPGYISPTYPVCLDTGTATRSTNYVYCNWKPSV